MRYTPAEFIQRTMMSALFIAFGFSLFFFPVALKFFRMSMQTFINSNLFLIPIILFVLVFFYLLKYPEVKIFEIQNGINKEITYAGRFLIIELVSGVPLYDAFVNLAKNYEIIGKHFQAIVDKVDMGTDMETAINEVTEATPSPNLRKILWQVLNSLKTGSDVNRALETVISQIVKEQQIEIKEYGRKLNPLAMFYMMIAVIIPSLGMTMFMVLSSFIGFKIDLAIFFTIIGIFAFIQFMFVALIKSSRPSVDL